MSLALCGGSGGSAVSGGWFWGLNGSIQHKDIYISGHDLSVRFNDLRIETPKDIPFVILEKSFHSNENNVMETNNIKKEKEEEEEVKEEEVEEEEKEEAEVEVEDRSIVVSGSRELIEIFSSNPTSPRRLPTLTVIYYSSSTNWDAYWELYHNWLVHVLLADVRETRHVRVVLDRCVEPCTMETITLTDHSLVVLNAHCSPKLDPFDVADEIAKRGHKNMALFHANHEQPWVEDVKDWRNGYHGGYEGLAEAYGKWDIVLRQHHFNPLASLLGAPTSSSTRLSYPLSKHEHHRGYLYVPLGPAYIILQQPFNQFGGARTVTSQRRILCSFAGAAGQYGGTSDRSDMLHVLNTSLPAGMCELHVAPQPIQPDTPAKQVLDRKEYNKMMFNSQFALCPGGNSYETFRHWEALGTAAIPISVTSSVNHSLAHLWCDPDLDSFVDSSLLNGRGHDAEYWLSYVTAMGCPLVLLPSWSDLPAFLDAFNMQHGIAGMARHSQVIKVLDKIQAVVMDRAEAVKLKTSKDISALFMAQYIN